MEIRSLHTLRITHDGNVMINQKRNLLLSLCVLFCLPLKAAEKLSPLALYSRCYSQITNQRVDLKSTLTQQVAAGTLSPIQACLQIFNKALFVNNESTIANTTDTESLAVVRTLHNLHSSWFTSKDFTDIDAGVPAWTDGSRDLWDTSTPALYFTKALFEPTPRFSSILTGQKIYIPVRTMMNPVSGAQTNLPISSYLIKSITQPLQFAPRGALIGVTETAPAMVSYPAVSNTINIGGLIKHNIAGTVPLYGSLGGGLLGNYTYALLNINQSNEFIANGGLIMPRKWGRNVYRDLFCRELPVIRITDALPYFDPKSDIQFRTSTGCVQCHASMDRISSVVRHARFTSLGTNTNRGATFINFPTATLPAETMWPITADSGYAQRPPNGTLYFRNYQGDLVDTNVSGVNDLATKILDQDDLYICAAKRYYEYFTGVSVFNGDISDPNGPKPNATAVNHRNYVIQLGKTLRQHNNLRLLITDILNSVQYQKSDSSF